MQIDIYLSHISREIHSYSHSFPSKVLSKLLSRPIDIIRHFYANKYRNTETRWIEIDNFDQTSVFKLDRSAYMGSLIYWRGYHHLAEYNLLKTMLTPEMVFLDIGANQGEFTIYAAKRLSKGRVIAFEPTKAIYEHLIENIELNKFKNVTTYNIGLSDHQGLVPIYTYKDQPSDLPFNEGLPTLFPSGEKSVQVDEIKLEVLDDLLPKENLNRLDIIKIDVEGAELHVLQGAEKSLELYKPILIIEVSEVNFQVAGYTVDELTKFIAQFNYKFFKISRSGHYYAIDRQEVSQMASKSSCNIMCKCP